MKFNRSSYFPLKSICPGAGAGVVFGPTTLPDEIDSLYPDRKLKLNSVILWNPAAKVHVGIASYIDAYRNGDADAIRRLAEWGMPPGAKFGYGPSDDLTCTYARATEKRRGRSGQKADSVKVMRAKFGAEYEDGGRFAEGDVVKIVFRKKFVGDGENRKFRNVYLRPSKDEIDDFLRSEEGA